MDDPSRPIVSIDIETTGLALKSSHVIEIGACLVVEGQLRRPVGVLVRPPRQWDLYTERARAAELVHGLTPEQVWEEGMPLEQASARMKDYLRRIEERYGPPILVAWGATFERRFLSRAPWGLERWTCVMQQAKRAFPGAPSYRLELLSRALGVDPGRSHRAMDDARTAAAVMLLARARLSG
jgi:DNA polymerase III epsilon subunit-like protein